MFVEVSGLRTYYEVHGEGEPVVLLHGGGVTAESWSEQVPALARQYRVFVPERRGHGRTPDSDGPDELPGNGQ
jgi:pimeloyl-ACP methyl ester carboxylesterase